MPLTDTACKNAKPSEKPRKLADGGGLFLLVQPTGGKLWRQAYRFDGKQKTLAHGSYPAATLQEARAERDAAKAMLARGIDPGEKKKTEKHRAKIAAMNTFESIAREWYDIRLDGWTVGYADRILRRLEADVFPELGRLPINEVEPPELLKVIRAVERRGAVVLAGPAPSGLRAGFPLRGRQRPLHPRSVARPAGRASVAGYAEASCRAEGP